MMLPNEQPFVVANGLRDDPAALRALMDRNGYLFFSGLVDPQVIGQARLEILALCRDAGWLDPALPLEQGVWNGQETHLEGEPAYMAVYRKWLRQPLFQRLPCQPVLLEIAEKIVGGEALVHERRIGRIAFPIKGDRIALTPPHQDWHFIRGAAQTYTLWLPLGDCPRALGNLAILAGSHRAQYQPHVPMKGVGGAGVALEDDPGAWHRADYKMGDFVIFHSHTVHQGLPNTSGRYLRLSVDNRYQRAGDEIDPSSMRQHYDIDLNADD